MTAFSTSAAPVATPLGKNVASPADMCAPPADPAKLALVIFASALLLGIAGGLASTGRFLDGGDGSWLFRQLANGGSVAPPGIDPYDPLGEYAEMPPLSLAEQLVAYVFNAGASFYR